MPPPPIHHPQAQLDELVSDRWKRRSKASGAPAPAPAASMAASPASACRAAESESGRILSGAGRVDDGVGVHVLVDGLGVLLGAQYVFAAGGGGGAWRRDVSLRADVSALSALVEGGRRVRQRLVWGPAATSGGGAWRRWRQCGYEARRCIGSPMAVSPGSGTDLQGEMAEEVDRQLRLSPQGARRTLASSCAGGAATGRQHWLRRWAER